jgi:hypothetical protein
MPHDWLMELTLDESAPYITHMGAAARALLVPGQSGQVLAAFSNVAYLLTASHGLFWVASGDAPQHRRCLKVTTPLPRFAAGAPFAVHDGRLKIGPGFAVDWAAAALWRPPPIRRDQVVEMVEIPGRVRALVSSLDFSPAQGFGRFIPDLLRCGPRFSAATDDPLLTHAKPLLLDMADACRSQDWQRIARGAEALIGLGGGLTPSGDDFLGGLLFGIRTLCAVYPDCSLFDGARMVAPWRARTNPISFTMLDDLANGFAIEPLHHIVSAILSAESHASIHPFILQLTQVGHSTGWDMLAGLFTGLLVTDPSSALQAPLELVESART